MTFLLTTEYFHPFITILTTQRTEIAIAAVSILKAVVRGGGVYTGGTELGLEGQEVRGGTIVIFIL